MNTQERAAYIEPKIRTALALLNSAVKQYKPKMVVGLMSGGDDSIPACYVASLHPQFSGILHVNTGIGIEATREHVRKVCAERGWKLWEYKASEDCKADGTPAPKNYDEIVLKYGFPGPSDHSSMYRRLKLRQIERFERDMVIGGRGAGKTCILYVSGMRRQESNRRGRNFISGGDIFQDKRRVWCSVIHDWNREDCGHAREHAGIPRNPVSERLGKSGECLCGAFAKPGDLGEIAFWYPETAERIRSLEAKARANGFPWGWEESAPAWWKAMKKGQCDFLAEIVPPEMQHLCHSCNKQAA
jgi:3'-phosphoadenosine 5'-phosphosulfate sulfotransferase (PAPS reductase)/FAD synthetase